MAVTVVGLGYVGLSMSVLLSRKFHIHAVDIDARKVELLENSVSPIFDRDITHHLENYDLNLHPTTDFDRSVGASRSVVIATPTDYDPVAQRFDVGSVRAVATKALAVNPDVNIVIKSTIPIGLVDGLREELGSSNIYFSPEFLREGNALQDNLYPSRIIVGGNDDAC